MAEELSQEVKDALKKLREFDEARKKAKEPTKEEMYEKNLALRSLNFIKSLKRWVCDDSNEELYQLAMKDLTSLIFACSPEEDAKQYNSNDLYEAFLQADRQSILVDAHNVLQYESAVEDFNVLVSQAIFYSATNRDSYEIAKYSKDKAKEIFFENILTDAKVLKNITDIQYDTLAIAIGVSIDKYIEYINQYEGDIVVDETTKQRLIEAIVDVFRLYEPTFDHSEQDLEEKLEIDSLGVSFTFLDKLVNSELAVMFFIYKLFDNKENNNVIADLIADNPTLESAFNRRKDYLFSLCEESEEGDDDTSIEELPIVAQKTPTPTKEWHLPEDFFTNQREYYREDNNSRRRLKSRITREKQDWEEEIARKNLEKFVNWLAKIDEDDAKKIQYIPDTPEAKNMFVLAISGYCPDPNAPFHKIQLTKARQGEGVCFCVKKLCKKPEYKSLEKHFEMNDPNSPKYKWKSCDDGRQVDLQQKIHDYFGI